MLKSKKKKKFVKLPKLGLEKEKDIDPLDKFRRWNPDNESNSQNSTFYYIGRKLSPTKQNNKIIHF